MSFVRETATNEEIKDERRRRYLELRATPYHQIEYAAATGLGQVHDDKEVIRTELPYHEE